MHDVVVLEFLLAAQSAGKDAKEDREGQYQKARYDYHQGCQVLGSRCSTVGGAIVEQARPAG